MSIRFTQSCPTCGRRLQIRTSLLGCTVACQHCQAEFVADSGIRSELQSSESMANEAADPLMMRVEKVLQRANEPTIWS
jgi:hypothetical protein